MYLCFNRPVRKNKIRFIHRTRIRLYPCLNKPIRKQQIHYMHWFQLKHETDFKFWNVKRRKALQPHANFTALGALICTGRIAERTASCYILQVQESTLFGPELLSSSFFTCSMARVLSSLETPRHIRSTDFRILKILF